MKALSLVAVIVVDTASLWLKEVSRELAQDATGLHQAYARIYREWQQPE